LELKRKQYEESIEKDHKIMNQLLLEEKGLVDMYRDNKDYKDDLKIQTDSRTTDSNYSEHYLESYKHVKNRLN
jgi:hypothetical protein